MLNLTSKRVLMTPPKKARLTHALLTCCQRSTLGVALMAFCHLSTANTLVLEKAQPTINKTLQQATNEITVNVGNIDTSRPGNILVMLYGEPGFPKDHQQALARKVLPATESYYTVSFTEVPEHFAIKILHDEDVSGEVSKNWTGFIPAEGLGFSNGAKLSFGPPKFKQARLAFSAVKEPLRINIIYP